MLKSNSKFKALMTLIICLFFIGMVFINLTFTAMSNLFLSSPWQFFIGSELPGLYLNYDYNLNRAELDDFVNYLIRDLFAMDRYLTERLVGSQFAPVRNYSTQIMAMAEKAPNNDKGLAEQEIDEEQKESSYVLLQETIDQELQNIEDKKPDDHVEDATVQVDTGKLVVYHTHTTESFVPDTGQPFVENLDKTVVQLGRKLVDELEQFGIETVHTEKIHDLPSRSESYARSLPTIKQILEETSEVEMVIDLHRDGISRDTTTAKVNGEKIGKTLIIVGSEGNPNWRENYQFALKLQKELEEIDQNLSRGIRTQNFSYNQEVHPRSLLIEIGSHENTLQEAKNTVPYLAEAIYNLLYTGD